MSQSEVEALLSDLTEDQKAAVQFEKRWPVGVKNIPNYTIVAFAFT